MISHKAGVIASIRQIFPDNADPRSIHITQLSVYHTTAVKIIAVEHFFITLHNYVDKQIFYERSGDFTEKFYLKKKGEMSNIHPLAFHFCPSTFMIGKNWEFS